MLKWPAVLARVRPISVVWNLTTTSSLGPKLSPETVSWVPVGPESLDRNSEAGDLSVPGEGGPAGGTTVIVWLDSAVVVSAVVGANVEITCVRSSGATSGSSRPAR